MIDHYGDDYLEFDKELIELLFDKDIKDSKVIDTWFIVAKEYP